MRKARGETLGAPCRDASRRTPPFGPHQLVEGTYGPRGAEQLGDSAAGPPRRRQSPKSRERTAWFPQGGCWGRQTPDPAKVTVTPPHRTRFRGNPEVPSRFHHCPRTTVTVYTCCPPSPRGLGPAQGPASVPTAPAPSRAGPVPASGWPQGGPRVASGWKCDLRPTRKERPTRLLLRKTSWLFGGAQGLTPSCLGLPKGPLGTLSWGRLAQMSSEKLIIIPIRGGSAKSAQNHGALGPKTPRKVA